MKEFSIALLLLFTLIHCSANTKSEYQRAKTTNTVESYQVFLKNFPDSPQALNAKLQIEKLTYKKN